MGERVEGLGASQCAGEKGHGQDRWMNYRPLFSYLGYFLVVGRHFGDKDDMFAALEDPERVAGDDAVEEALDVF